MVTEAQTSPDGEWIPRYFSDFRREFDVHQAENTAQHAELADRINAARIESSEQFARLSVQIAEVRGEFRELRGEFRALKTIGIVIASSGAVLTAAAVTAVARYVLGG